MENSSSTRRNRTSQDAGNVAKTLAYKDSKQSNASTSLGCKIEDDDIKSSSTEEDASSNDGRRRRSSKGMQKCRSCDKTFGTLKELASHNKSVHRERNQKLKCPFPGCTFARMHQMALDKHIKSRHGSGLRCKHCGMEFSSQGKRSKHILHIHPEGTCACRECGKRFMKTKSLNKHEKILHNEACEACQKKFVSTRALSQHVLLEHNTNLCKHCGKKYLSAKRLEIHIQSIHRSCRMCGKNFEATRSCRTHESVPHTFVCELCNKAFIQKKMWSDHMYSKHNFKTAREPRTSTSKPVRKLNSNKTSRLLPTQINTEGEANVKREVIELD